jgi:uncharacterized protein YndB with AHSA1/START domain
MSGIVAHAEITVSAPPERVWQALTDPAEVKQYFFGTDLRTDWQPGSPVTWSGEWQGQAYEDKGEVIAVDPPRHLELTHFSPLTGQEDKPENYHRLVFDLEEQGGGTHVALTQDNNRDEEAAEHTRQNWEMVLQGLKKLVEGS